MALWWLLAACTGGTDPVTASESSTESEATSTLDTACDPGTLASGYAWLTAEAVTAAGDEDEGPWDVVVCDPDAPAVCLEYADLMREDSSGDQDGNETFTSMLDAVSPPAAGRYWWVEDLVAGPEPLCAIDCCYAVDAWLRYGEPTP